MFEGRAISAGLNGHNVCSRRHNPICGRFAQRKHVLYHSLLLLINRALHSVLLELGEEFFLFFFLLLLRACLGDAGESAHKAVV